jgi:carbohydrate diacid regulator
MVYDFSRSTYHIYLATESYHLIPGSITMKLTIDIAYPIIQKLTNTLNYNINIIDDQGVIIASFDPTRVDYIHEGAIEVLKLKKPFIIKTEDISHFSGTREGVNLPIDFLGEVIGVVGITGSPDEVMELAQMTKITVELMLQQAYLQRQAQFNQQLIHSWVMDMINPDFIDETKLTNQAKHFLNLDLEKETAVLLLQIPTLQSLNQLDDLTRRNELIDDIYRHVKTTVSEVSFLDVTHEDLIIIGISIPYHKTEVQLAKTLSHTLVEKNITLYSNCRIAVGGRKTLMSGIRQSYFESRQSLQLMMKFKREENISHIGEWGLIGLLDQVPIHIRHEFLIQYSLEKLPPDLIDTLNTLFDYDNNLSLTAEKLHIHRNTLTYRLENIHQIIKLNPKSSTDLAMLYVLMILQKLEGE